MVGSVVGLVGSVEGVVPVVGSVVGLGGSVVGVVDCMSTCSRECSGPSWECSRCCGLYEYL